MRFTFINRSRITWPVPTLCRVLEVSESGFWAWLKRPLSARATSDAVVSKAIIESHDASHGIYGMAKIRMDLRCNGLMVGRRTVMRLMRENDISGASGRSPRPRTTISNPLHEKAENILSRDFTADRPNQRWVTDITVIETDEGRLYLAAIEDLFSRKIVGWELDTHMETSLVERALKNAITERKPLPGLTHHSDRGCQYTSNSYRQMLKEYGIQASMSRSGNCHDNACAESFWGRLKVEWIYRTHFATHAAARAAIFYYIECFYNRTRRHSTLGYLSPNDFEVLHAAN